MSHVQLDNLKPRCHRPPRRRRKLPGYHVDIANRHLPRRLISRSKRDRARRDRLPSPVRTIHRLPTKPRKIGARLPPRMSQLNRRNAPLFTDKFGDAPNPSACRSVQMPLSSGEIRPSNEMAVASTQTIAAPPTARLPRCTKCQSVGIPSSLLYWHIGETKMRFLNVSSRSCRGENNLLIDADYSLRIHPWIFIPLLPHDPDH